MSINKEEFYERLATAVVDLDEDLAKSLSQEAVDNGIDLQLSGHTHNGQFWPFNYLVKSMFELSWGYKQKGNSQFYVSSGYGSWGPPVRIGSQSEIVIIEIGNGF